MQDAATVLDVIGTRGARGLPVERLYRQMLKPQLYLMAYRKLYANKGAMTPGVSGETGDGMSLAKIGAVIGALRAERYRWGPPRPTARRTRGQPRRRRPGRPPPRPWSRGRPGRCRDGRRPPAPGARPRAG